MFNHERHSGKLLITSILLFILMLAFFIAFIVELKKSPSDNVSAENFTVCCTQDCQASEKFIKESIDFSADPCDDFYKYSCGNWLKNNPLPDTDPQRGVMTSVAIEVNARVKSLLNNPNSLPSPAEEKARILYKSCMYEDKTVETTAIKGIKELLAKLGGWPIIMDNWIDDSKRTWWEAVATVKNVIGKDVILGTYVIPNLLNTEKYSIMMQIPAPDQLQVGSMSIPHIVFSATEKPDVLAAYRQYILETVCLLASDAICRSPNTPSEIQNILQLEVGLAGAIQQTKLMDNLIPKGVVLGDTIFQSPNLRADINIDDVPSWIMKVKDLNTKVVGVDWEKFLRIILNGTQIDSTPDLEVVAITPYLKNIVNFINTQPKKTIANFIGWKVLEYLNSYTSPRLREIQFGFSKKVYGVKAQAKLEDACVILATTTMGFAVTSLYAKAHVGAGDIEHAKNLITNIKNGFHHTLNENNWLDETTKEKARKKLTMMEENVAFPLWNNDTKKVDEYYQQLPQFSETDFLQNALSAMKVNFLNSFGILKGPVDRKNAWPIKNPLLGNAFYYPNINGFYLLLGLMGLPVLSKNNLQTLNYGGIGYIIGHEVMHGFDTTGSLYDELGRMINWWSPQSQSGYQQRANCMINQYNIPLDEDKSLSINGQLTIGENIADNGGIKGSFWGYKSAVKEDIRLPGLTSLSGDRLFFISAAQLWCTNTRPEMTALLIANDNHSPAKYRVNIPFHNSDEFLNAFKCDKNSKMNIGSKCVIF